MKRHRVLHLLSCFHFAALILAAPLKKDATGKQVRLFSHPSDGAISLLAILQGLQQKRSVAPTAVVASEVQLQQKELRGQTEHERQLLSDMGHLESQLESWKNAEKSLEQQVAQQAATVTSLKEREAQALHEAHVAATVWWDCKVAMFLISMPGVAFFIYSKSSCSPKSGISASSKTTDQVRRVRAQPEFVEEDVGTAVEDILEVDLHPHPPSHPIDWTDMTEEPSADLEAHPKDWADMVDNDAVEAAKRKSRKPKDSWNVRRSRCTTLHDTSPEIPLHDNSASSSASSALAPIERQNSSSSNTCQFFSLAEEDPVHALTTDDWWGEASSGY